MSSALRTACLALVATLLVPAVASAQSGGPDGYGYLYDVTTYEFVDITTTGVALGLGDEGEEEVALPFAFGFYGVDYNWLTIGANGGLVFSDGTGTEPVGSYNQSLPTTGYGAPDVAVLWDDQDDGSGDVYYLDDSAANDRFIVSWVDTPQYYSPGEGSYQVHLNGDGTIEFHYADVVFDSSSYDYGAGATVGIQDLTGGTASPDGYLEIGYNSVFLADMDAYVFYTADADGDGFADALLGGDDCDDTNPLIYPGAAETCNDGIDDDCDGADDVDDFDADTFVNLDCGGDDCDDNDAATFPGAVEICDDGIDNDCDAATVDLFDIDADGFTCDVDCDDNVATTYPGAPEVCGNGVDDDCNGWDQDTDMDLDGDTGIACGGNDCDDFDATISTLIDVDGDGSNACEDCDDADANNFPGNVELCDGMDNDCDGDADDQDDLDADGVDTCSGDCDDLDPLNFPGNVEICDLQDNDCDGVIDDIDADMDGFFCDVDCDDADATVYPGADELCDTIDSDCDGLDDAFDFDIVTTVSGSWSEFLADAQDITSANPTTTSTMTVASGLTDVIVDVNVTLNLTHTFDDDLDIWLVSPLGTAVELITDIGVGGDDMLGTVLDDDAFNAIADFDDSTFAPFTGTWQPEGLLADLNGEAIDGDWMLEITDDMGGDTGALIDWTLDFEVGTIADDDTDLDGALASCGDCDDTDPTIFPGALEVCGDSIDQDCLDGDLVADVDADTFVAIDCGGDDCDDNDATINPDAAELCDTVDSDCDGLDDAFDLDIGATVGAPATGTSAPALAIDAGPHDDTVDLTGATGQITDVNVTVNITHPWVGDMEISLISPAGTEVMLADNRGSSGDNYNATVFDDQAAQSISSIASWDEPFTGSWTPDDALAAFNGEPVDGVWTLSITDTSTSWDDGVLDDWTIEITTGTIDDADLDGAVDSCGDCDSADADVFPGATEVCGDGIDQDCDTIDLVVDEDADTYNDDACGGDDCDDADAAINPMATEVCGDGVDADCDGDDNNADLDGDGFASALDCGGADCDDTDATIFPGAPEACDSIDTDCDGLTDGEDIDVGATLGTPATGTSAPALDIDSGPHDDTIDLTGATGDVFDVNVTVNITHTWVGDLEISLVSPVGTAVLLSNNRGSLGDDMVDTIFDDDAGMPISGVVSGDAPFTGSWIPDNPLDTFLGEAVDGVWTLSITDTSTWSDDGVLVDWTLDIVTGTVDDADMDGFVGCSDCDDTDDTVFPGAPETCGDGIDQDCDGSDDLADGDADTFTNADCGGDDCDDASATVFPGAPEVCNDFVDNDCDVATEDIFDGDADGALCDVDCDDMDPLVFPGFFEICNDGIDNDCDIATPDLLDADGDGVSCELDCDDTNPAAYPGATELLCTGVEEDCDATVDPDIADGDGDTFTCDLDCDDSNPAVNPGALEFSCDGIDNDCDGEVDTDDGANVDVDMDGATCDVDCDDDDPTRFPGNVEVCDDTIDNDCDPSTDDVHDFDLDGADCIVDCDDDDPMSFPGAPEICGDGIDQDCDTVVDELVADVYDLDDDDSLLIGLCSFSFPFCGGDWDTLYVQDNGRVTFGFDDQTSAESIANLLAQTPEIAPLWTDLDPSAAGTVTVTEDDGVSLTVDFTGVPQFGMPGTANNFELILWVDGMATITYGDVDETDGLVGFSCGDTDVVSVDFTEINDDIIGQGTEDALYEQFSDLGSPNDLGGEQLDLCLTAGVDDDGDGWTDACGDCDDFDATAFPGNVEVCGDTVDNDCDGIADNADVDEDGFIDDACAGTDCDDTDADINPDATEVCNEIDDDCDGIVEDDELDGDGDGETPCMGDCDDTDADISTAAVEICDIDADDMGIDNDCDGVANEGFDEDLDEDGFISELCGGDDCDDTREGAFPGGDEICDGGDNDCDGTVDNVDQDADTFIDEACGGDDCNDADAAINPDAEEIPYDGIDNDCGDDGDTTDVDGDGQASTDAGGTDCNDNDAAISAGVEEICDDEVDNDCDELTDGDDEECGACADCNSSFSGAGTQGGLLALLLVAVAAIRRRRE
jgi:MYXO-CTERM domain-containing protein